MTKAGENQELKTAPSKSRLSALLCAMFKAYKGLRKATDHTRWACVKFQLNSWRIDLKHLPRKIYMDWRLRRMMKKDPRGFKVALESLEKMMNEKSQDG